MNYNHIQNLNKRQFDITMKRECITVADYFNKDVTYNIFCRRNNRSNNPQGKLRIFYAKTTPIVIGTIFVLKGEYFLVTSQDAIESEVYFTSMAVKCDTYFNVLYNNSEYVSVPCVTISDKYTLSHGSTISIINGTVTVMTGLNQYSKFMEVNDEYYAYGGKYKVGNFFYNDGLAYVYMTREATNAEDNYVITYTGEKSLDMSTMDTYQLTYSTVDPNGLTVNNPKLSYVSSNPAVATVDKNGLLTLLSAGSTQITTTWEDGGLKECNTTITVV